MMAMGREDPIPIDEDQEPDPRGGGADRRGEGARPDQWEGPQINPAPLLAIPFGHGASGSGGSQGGDGALVLMGPRDLAMAGGNVGDPVVSTGGDPRKPT